jgi:hypothetical protein
VLLRIAAKPKGAVVQDLTTLIHLALQFRHDEKFLQAVLQEIEKIVPPMQDKQWTVDTLLQIMNERNDTP